jgi:hypothetical protein
MTVQFLKAAGVNHSELREKLKTDFGLQDGEEALVDTLDGLSDFKEMCAAAIREIKFREAQAVALKGLIADMKARLDRIERSADHARATLAEAMLNAHEYKLALPDYTVSARKGAAKLIIDDTELPDGFKTPVITTKPNRDAIKAALDAGKSVPGVRLSNPEPVLAIRGA